MYVYIYIYTHILRSLKLHRDAPAASGHGAGNEPSGPCSTVTQHRITVTQPCQYLLWKEGK